MIPTTFDFAVQDSVGVLTLNRPDRLNALTFESYAELRDFFEHLNGRDDVRAIVLHGAGRAFCSGGDVEDIIGELFSRDMKGLLTFTQMTGALIQNIRRVRVPVIAAIHGVAVGAGAVMAIACDMRIIGPRAKFGFIFPQVGLCGADMGSAYLLPRIVGLGHASELLFTGEIIKAERAVTIGLANRMVEEDAVLVEALEMAKKIARGPAFAHAMTKKMIEDEANLSLEAAIEAEAQAQAICMAHPDFREAYDSWVEKRPPRFEGLSKP
ncbi:MAG: enoyl-CoA hydratase family protein [Myxococcota bacterium]|nr:enoyl-CoA hydratase family protein [Myxococcota bacterium]